MYNQDPSGALFMILPQVLMMQDISNCYTCKVRSIGDMKIREEYERLCENGALKEEYNIAEKKGLTCTLNFPNVFKTKWIKIVLSRIHDISIWLENGIVKITNKIVHRVAGYPTLD